ncbi:hypothetical protein AVEN_103190-1 [Araneus ventricosus]|uniref:Uncharacterized protein n=1 Tax=Araneus ventricosus TaxID=182803 RepID=A0A4Y2FWA0_ARAVE|nr:hypothetical protein AVEN_103190-1 [Araneus ventricosus]
MIKILDDRGAIRHKRPGILNNGVILLHGNTHIARKAAKVQVGGLLPSSPDLAPNLGYNHLSGTRLSSNSDVKTADENWINEKGRYFYQSVVKQDGPGFR